MGGKLSDLNKIKDHKKKTLLLAISLAIILLLAFVSYAAVLTGTLDYFIDRFSSYNQTFYGNSSSVFNISFANQSMFFNGTVNNFQFGRSAHLYTLNNITGNSFNLSVNVSFTNSSNSISTPNTLSSAVVDVGIGLLNQTSLSGQTIGVPLRCNAILTTTNLKLTLSNATSGGAAATSSVYTTNAASFDGIMSLNYNNQTGKVVCQFNGKDINALFNMDWNYSIALIGEVIYQGSGNVTGNLSVLFDNLNYTNGTAVIEPTPPDSLSFPTGNITMEDVDINSSSKFNFSTQKLGALGHFRFDNTTTGGAVIQVVNGSQAKLMPMGMIQGPFSNLEVVPNQNTVDFLGTGYGTFSSVSVFPNTAIAFTVANGSAVYYGALRITTINLGSNITFEYKFNNISGNNSFTNQADTGCELHTTSPTCLTDKENNCEWKDNLAKCDTFGDKFLFDDVGADCHLLQKPACDGINSNYCVWNASVGSIGQCQYGSLYDASKGGFNCTAITNSSLCNSETFTEQTGLCTWNGSNCLINKTKSSAQITQPPVFSCSAPGYVDNQANCLSLANTYFLPCTWNTSQNKCISNVDTGTYKTFESVASEFNCKILGGLWKNETTYDPINNKLTIENWCEFGVLVKGFSTVGGGGSGFTGSLSQLNDCDTDCFACEYQSNGSVWATGDAASSACTNSEASCLFKSDKNAFNGLGYCVPSLELGDFNCDTSCGDCNLKSNPQTACLNSTAGCKWDNVSNECFSAGTKTCSQECFQCFNQSTCQTSTANGGCNWGSNAYVCTPKGGEFEICFDAVDNDGNGKTDCLDSKCSSDIFCAGGSSDSSNCFQYDLFKYKNTEAARGNCTAVSGCSWAIDDYGFSFCAPTSEQCYLNKTLSDNQSICQNFNDGKTCSFVASTFCEVNTTMEANCFNATTQNGCQALPGCLWNDGFCDIKVIGSCEDNATLQASQSVCESAGCFWQGSSFGATFEGNYYQNCVNPCQNTSITSSTQCTVASGSAFASGSCRFKTGFCETKGFVGGCEGNDGNYAGCMGNNGCVWKNDLNGPLLHLNGSTTTTTYQFPGTEWIAVGLQKPTGGSNLSQYILKVKNPGASDINLTLFMSTYFPPGNSPINLSQITCNTGQPMMQYNFSVSSCLIGTCNAYGVGSCGNRTVHYYLNSSKRELEVLWEISTSNLTLDSSEGNTVVTDTGNFARVLIDGNLSEQIVENGSATDSKTNATRVIVASGFCDDSLTNNFFKKMEDNAPFPFVFDTINAANDPSADYLDLENIGYKKTDDAYIYALKVDNITHSALCYNTPLPSGAVGVSKNSSKYYLYLDTNGIVTGGCSPIDNSSYAGFEYLFRYVAEFDGTTSKTTETLVTQQCANNSWVASNVPFKTNKEKSCGLTVFNGPIFGIDKDAFTGKDNVNTTASWRSYATNAANGGNASNITDSIGPNKADITAIDVKIIDCTSTNDKDKSQCTKFKQFGFFPGEFGPACKDSIDNDADSLTDCDDLDCKFDQFFCGGSFTALEDDTSAPSFVMNKVNDKLTNSLEFIFGTSEPANGSVRFYNNDTSCATINTTLLDAALSTSQAFDDYRMQHVASVEGLNANITYYYKLEACDPSKNCALSQCINATTAASATNITFKLVVPSGWTIDIPTLNLTNYSATYALKAPSNLLSNTNITMNKTSDGITAVNLVGASIFEKQTINLSQITISNSNFLSFDSNHYQSIKQKLGLEKVIIKIPIEEKATKIQHCDDNGANCIDVTSSLTCTFAGTFALCTIPDALGLGFSGYQGSSGASAGGGNGGGSNLVSSSSSSSSASSKKATIGTRKALTSSNAESEQAGSSENQQTSASNSKEGGAGSLSYMSGQPEKISIKEALHEKTSRLPLVLSIVLVSFLLYLLFAKKR